MANKMWRKVGKVLLFVGAWAIATLGMYIFVLIFFGAVLLPWGDIITPIIATCPQCDLMPDLLVLYGITFIVTSAPAAYIAQMVVYKPSTMEDDRWMNRIDNALSWMMLTIMYSFGLMLMIGFGLILILMDPANPSEDFRPEMMKEWRYLFVAALIVAGYLAWRKLPSEKSDESREP